MDLGESLPKENAFDMLLLMGGPMNIYMDRDFPWLRAERAFIAAAVARGCPAIGVCLGSQFLADALGGRVTQNPEREIGWHPIRFSDAAKREIPGLPESETVLHWHGDTFALPAGAIRLASSEACENQAFLYEGRILGLQFHPEMTRAAVEQLLADDGPLPSGRWVQQQSEILATPDAMYQNAAHLLVQILDGVFS
jgi:GMP synthase-like glutamine amidotransferase